MVDSIEHEVVPETEGGFGDGLVAVTGVTGVVGGFVSDELERRRIAHRQLVRDPSRLARPGSDVRIVDYGDGDGARAALEGVQTLFMVSGHESTSRMDEHLSFISAARDAGVAHIVYTSFLNAAPDAIFTLAREHFETEKLIRESGINFTFLRDSFYADFLPFLEQEGVISGPAGTGSVGAVSRRDVALAAVAVLAAPQQHRGQTYELTGPQALTLEEVAQLLAEARGYPVVYRNQTIEEAYEDRRALSGEDWQLDAWVSTYTAIAAGELSKVTDDVFRLTGRAPLKIEQVIGNAVAKQC